MTTERDCSGEDDGVPCVSHLRLLEVEAELAVVKAECARRQDRFDRLTSDHHALGCPRCVQFFRQDENATLVAALEEIVQVPCGIAGHSVAVGCRSASIARAALAGLGSDGSEDGIPCVSHLALMDAEARAAVLEACLLAITVRLPSGQVCYVTANGVPMAMPKKLERITRATLAVSCDTFREIR